MDHSVQFDNEQTLEETAIRPPKPLGLGDTLMHVRLVNSPGEAMALIAIVISLLISASIYLLASSVHTGPALSNETQSEGSSHSMTP